MITLSLQAEKRPLRVKPNEGLVYQNTKGNLVLVLTVNDQNQSAQVIIFNSATGRMMGFHSYTYHCIAKWPLVGRAYDMPLIQVQELTQEEIEELEKYRGIL